MQSVQIATLTLSTLPPSVNNMFANVQGKGRVKTKKYRDWALAAAWEIAAQKPGRVEGPYGITLIFKRANGRADLDNLIKASQDLLVASGVVTDDRFAQRIVAEWGNVEGVHIQVCSTKERT